jgi:hypothetical protein
MAQLILFGIATEVWMLYLAVCIGSVFNVLTPVIRSRITKLIEPNEYATVFIPAMILQSGGYYAIGALGNEIYAVSITFLPGLVNFFFAMFGALSIMLLLYVKSFMMQKTKGISLFYINTLRVRVRMRIVYITETCSELNMQFCRTKFTLQNCIFSSEQVSVI